MNLPPENYTIRKSAREAADSGIILWRKDFAYFLLFFEVPLLLCAFILRQLPGKYIYLSWLLLWWLKPFFSRTVLHVVSVRFFEPNAGIKRLSKGLRHSLFYGLFGDLLWRRFSLFRAGILPVRVLESPKKRKNFIKRKKLLDKGGLSYCSLLSIWGSALEAALLAGELIFIFMMSHFIGIELDISDSDFILNAEKYIFVLWCINYFLIETMYICMGFGVYINSRIEAEGWDIKNIFKKKSVLSIILFVSFLLLIIPAPAFSEPAELKNNKVPLEILNEIYESSDFGGEKDTWEIKLKKLPEEKEEEIIINKYRNKNYFRILEYLLASGLRIVIIVFIITAVVLLIIFARRFIIKKSYAIKEKPALSVMQKTKQINLRELLKNAINNKTDLRLAWGYCTAATILLLQKKHGFNFPPDADESDCVKIASAKLGETDEIKKFRTIILTWIKFVYAGILPLNDSLNEAAAFCTSLLNEAENE